MPLMVAFIILPNISAVCDAGLSRLCSRSCQFTFAFGCLFVAHSLFFLYLKVYWYDPDLASSVDGALDGDLLRNVS